jgi:hypothetical protein
MDPTVCFNNISDYLEDGELDKALEATVKLLDWYNKDGVPAFFPGSMVEVPVQLVRTIYWGLKQREW